MSDLEKTHDLVPTPASPRALTAPEFHQLAQVPPAAEWFANIDNPNTRRACSNDLQEFMGFAGITTPEEFPAGHSRTCPGVAPGPRAP